MDFAKDHSVKQGKYYGKDKSTWYQEALYRFNILCNIKLFDSFAVDICYHYSCYIKYMINPAGKLDNKKEECENKYSMEEMLYILNGTLSVCIIRETEAFCLPHILGYLKEGCNDHGIELIFTHLFRLKRELLKKFENESDFFLLAKLVIVHSSTMNPYEYSIADLKAQVFQDKDHERLRNIFHP